MTNLNEQQDQPRPLSPEELTKLQSFRVDRDRCAQIIGVATYEWRTFIRSREREIDRLLHEEGLMAAELFRVRGLDARHWVLDPTTGEFSPAPGNVES